MTPIKDELGRVIKFVGVQVDVTNKTEGHSYTDSQGVPVLVHYDDRWAPRWRPAGGRFWADQLLGA